MAKKDFNEYRFGDLNFREVSNNYITMDRYNDTEDKIVVNVAEEHLLPTKYGYALILDYNHVVWLKNWQVSVNYFRNEVLLCEEYFNVKEWGQHEQFGEADPDELTWEAWLETAKEQQAAGTVVKWYRKD